MNDAEKWAPSFGGYMFVQSALLFCAYGLGYTMPWWVRWFPRLVMPALIAVVLFIAIVAGVAGTK